MLEAILANSYSFGVTSVERNKDMIINRDYLIISAPIALADALEPQLTKPNLATVTVKQDGDPIRTYEGFDSIAGIRDSITEFAKSYIVTLSQGAGEPA